MEPRYRVRKIEKNMLIFILILVSAIFAGCSPTRNYYFYSTLSSIDQNLEQDTTGIFKAKNTDFDTYYSFNGQNITMKLSINNKMTVPLLINWDKSTIKVNKLSAMPISKFAGFSLKKLSSEIAPNTRDNFILLNSAHFDLKTVNKKQLQNQKIYISDQRMKTKSIEFDNDTSPLILTSNVCVTINKKDTVITNTFFVSRISNIKQNAYITFQPQVLLRKDGFYSFYEVARGKNSKLADGIFDQLIKTSIHSIGHEGIKNDSKYDENTFYVPNR